MFKPLSGALGLTALLALGAPGLAPSPDRDVTLPAGTKLVGVLRQPVSTHDNSAGDQIAVRTTESFRVGEVKIPSGLLLRGELTEAKGGGRISGDAKLVIRFDRLTVEGREYQMVAEPFRVVGKSETKNTLKKVIGGTVAGGVVGAVAGNAGKGILIGAVLGSGVAVATKGGHLTLAEGQQVEVRLAEPLTLTLRNPVIAYPQ